MDTKRYAHSLLPLIGCCLVFLLAACGSSSTGAAGPTPTPGSTKTVAQGGSTPTPAPTTPPQSTPTPLPAVQTSCPATGTARSAVMPPLAAGSQQNIVYIVNETQNNQAPTGTLKRFDVTTGNKTVIVTIPGVSISDAQLSADGQWILFLADGGGIQKLQLVRVDGQQLQTLYCGNSIYNLQWSANQQSIAFVNYVQQSADIYLLGAQDGSLKRVFHPGNLTGQGIDGFHLETWLDATHLYLLTQPLDQPADTLSLLDVTRGSNQGVSNLQQVYKVPSTQSAFCWSNDSSYDGKSLYASQCTGGDPRGGHDTQGPSTITSEPATGGSQHTLFSSPTQAVTVVRSLSASTLFYIVDNNAGDVSQNGIWKINTDGSGRTQLVALSGSGTSSTFSLNQYTQYPSSNFSRGNSLYTVEEMTVQGNNITYNLFYGSLNGGNLTSFASIVNTELDIVGWTAM